MNPTKQLQSSHHDLDGILDRFAPMKARAGVIERYPTERPQLLSQRLGMTAEEVVAALKSGLLRPVNIERGNSGETAGFDGSDLDRIRRGAILDGLEQLAATNPRLDSHDLAAVADRSMTFATRAKRPVIELSAEHKGRFRAAIADARTVRFSAADGDAVLRKAGARVFGLDVPLNGKVPRDKYVKKIRDEDLDRRDANIVRAGAAGAAAGALMKAGKLGSLTAGKRAILGAAAGAGGVLAIRRVTAATSDAYGERSRGAKRAEDLPAIAGAGVAGVAGIAAIKKLIAARKMAFSRREKEIIFEAAKETGHGDFVRAFGERAFNDPRIIQLGLESIGPAIAALLRKGGKFAKGALLPGTTANSILKVGAKGAAVGAVGGGVQAVTDGDPNTGLVGGVLRGAAGGAAVGGAVGLIKGSTPFVAGSARDGLEAAAEKLRRKYAGSGYVV